MEVVLGLEVTFNGVQIHKNIIKLFQQEETRGHTLSAWNGIAFCGTGTNDLEQLLG